MASPHATGQRSRRQIDGSKDYGGARPEMRRSLSAFEHANFSVRSSTSSSDGTGGDDKLRQMFRRVKPRYKGRQVEPHHRALIQLLLALRIPLRAFACMAEGLHGQARHESSWCAVPCFTECCRTAMILDGLERTTKRAVIVKAFSKQQMSVLRRENMDREVSILRAAAGCPGVPKFISTLEDSHCHYIVIEAVQGAASTTRHWLLYTPIIISQ